MVSNNNINENLEKITLEDSLAHRIERGDILYQLQNEIENTTTYDSVLSSINMENRFSEKKSIDPLTYISLIKKAQDENIPYTQVEEDLKEYC